MIAPTENTCGGDDDERLGAPPPRALQPPIQAVALSHLLVMQLIE